MRLLHIDTYELEEFYDDTTPTYAILSHRWEGGEVSFQDMQRDDRTTLPGWAKIQGFCEQVRLNSDKLQRFAEDMPIEYVWIDSCCIDKTSSAELSEAINSMFEWYKAAEVCYAYLSDVAFHQYNGVDEKLRNEQQFLASKWFTRGWTLQELLAPCRIHFYDRNWIQLFPDSALLRKASGIKDLKTWQSASVACKLSWAANRQCTRIEDTAYSLMGLFGVHMPTLYGEGKNAFYRLQLEIIRESDDESIFAWTNATDLTGGLLASTVSAFQNSGEIEVMLSSSMQVGILSGAKERPPYTMTNKGLRLEGFPPILKVNDPDSCCLQPTHGDTALCPIFCTDKGHGRGDNCLAIALRLVDPSRSQWARVRSGELFHLSSSQQRALNAKLNAWETYYVKQLHREVSCFHGPYTFYINSESIEKHAYQYEEFRVHHDSADEHFPASRHLVGRDPGRYTRLQVDQLPARGNTFAFRFGAKTSHTDFWLFITIENHKPAIRLGPGSRLWNNNETKIFIDPFEYFLQSLTLRDQPISTPTARGHLVKYLVGRNQTQLITAELAAAGKHFTGKYKGGQCFDVILSLKDELDIYQ